MPKKPLTPEVAKQLVEFAKNDQLLSLQIGKYKSGKYKGEHYADFQEGLRTLPLDSVNVLKNIASYVTMMASDTYEIALSLPINERLYVRMITKGDAPLGKTMESARS